MNLVAVLLTYLFFCHPKVLLLLALVFAIILLIVHYPAGFLFLLMIAAGILAYKVLVG